MESIRRVLEPVALICPHITLTLHDESRDVKVFATRKVDTAPRIRQMTLIAMLTIHNTNCQSDSSQSIFRQLFGISISKDLVSVRKSGKGYLVEGFISLRGFPSKVSGRFIILSLDILIDTNHGD